MNIRNNCRKATFLIEKKSADRITFVQNFELTIHLAGCPNCRRFRRQSLYINQLIAGLMRHADEVNIELDETFKKDLEKMISHKIESADDQNFL